MMQSEPPRRTRTVAVLAGDGVGPEVVREATAVLDVVASLTGLPVAYEHRLIGGAAIEAEGAPISAETVAACRAADAVLVGATGGPRWDRRRGSERPGYGLLSLRRELGTFANLRPIRVHPALIPCTPFRDEVVRGTDILIVRELTGGAYFGEHSRSGSGADEHASDVTTYSRAEIERVARVAFDLAGTRGGRVTSVDKAGVLWSGALWRDVVTEVAAEYPGVTVEHQLVDSFAARLIERPRDLDVVLTENLFGDILSDEAAVLTGSLGLLPSASLGNGGPGLYEPAHGSAPQIAGTGRANPIAAILSVALLLEHSLDAPAAAALIRAAVDDVITARIVTPDLGGTASTREVGDAVIAALRLTASTRDELVGTGGVAAR